MQHRAERDGLVRDRIKVILAYDQGYTQAQIAAILLIGESTVRDHLRDYEQQDGKLKPLNGGSASKLDAEQTSKLLVHLEEVTYLRTADIVAYVEATFGVTYSVAGLTSWLHAHEFSWKKPSIRPGKADAAAQAAWVEAYEQRLNNLPAEDVVYFCDAVHPTHNVKLAYGWIRIGQRKEIPSNSGRKRLNVLGACSLHTLQAIIGDYDTIDGAATVEFLKKLEAGTIATGTIHLHLDNARYFKSKEVQEFLKTTRFKLHFLPPYSPNLNPIERLWRFMYQKTLANQYFEKFEYFKEAIFGFFDDIDKYYTDLQSLLTDNFQVFQPLARPSA
jgi:transposase